MMARKSLKGKAPVKAVGRAAPSLPQKRPAAIEAAAETAEAGQVAEGSDPAAGPERPAKKARKKPPAGSAAGLASALHSKSEAEASGLQRRPEASAASKDKKEVAPSSPEALCGLVTEPMLSCAHQQIACLSWPSLEMCACGAMASSA